MHNTTHSGATAAAVRTHPSQLAASLQNITHNLQTKTASTPVLAEGWLVTAKGAHNSPKRATPAGNIQDPHFACSEPFPSLNPTVAPAFQWLLGTGSHSHRKQPRAHTRPALSTQSPAF